MPGKGCMYAKRVRKPGRCRIIGADRIIALGGQEQLDAASRQP